VEAELGRYLDWLRGHGVAFEIADGLAREPDHSGPLVEGAEELRPVELDGIPPFVEHRDPAAGIAADHATFSLARAILPGLAPGTRFWDIGCGTGVLAVAAGIAADHATFSLARAILPGLAPGTRFWDIGCGTGVLAVAAGLKGARGVIATDVDPRALLLARRTAAEADVAVTFLEGSLTEPIDSRQTVDVVAANLPHKPVPEEHALPVAQSGGPEGDACHGELFDQARERLEAGAKICFFLHSLPHPRLLRRYAGDFVLTLRAWKRRFFQPDEYGDLQDHFQARAREGTSYVAEADGRRFLVAGCWEALRQ